MIETLIAQKAPNIMRIVEKVLRGDGGECVWWDGKLSKASLVLSNREDSYGRG